MAKETLNEQDFIIHSDLMDNLPKKIKPIEQEDDEKKEG
jgi:hypothetical protein